MIMQQQATILDQHTRLKVQEEVLGSLKARKGVIDHAFSCPDPELVCQRMCAVSGAVCCVSEGVGA